MADYIIGWALYWVRWYAWARPLLAVVYISLWLYKWGLLTKAQAGSMAGWALRSIPDDRRWNRLVGARWAVPHV
jgi:hypothetical protein